MSWFYHHHLTVQWPSFANSELLFQIPFYANFPNCRPGPFLVANFGNCRSRSLFLHFFKLLSWISFLQTLEILVQDPFFFYNFSNCCLGYSIANLWIELRSRSLILQIVKNSLGPKTKNRLIFEWFFLKEITVLKRVCDRKEEQVEKIDTFFFLLTSHAFEDEMIRDDDGDKCENHHLHHLMCCVPRGLWYKVHLKDRSSPDN